MAALVVFRSVPKRCQAQRGTTWRCSRRRQKLCGRLVKRAPTTATPFPGRPLMANLRLWSLVSFTLLLRILSSKSTGSANSLGVTQASRPSFARLDWTFDANASELQIDWGAGSKFSDFVEPRRASKADYLPYVDKILSLLDAICQGQAAVPVSQETLSMIGSIDELSTRDLVGPYECARLAQSLSAARAAASNIKLISENDQFAPAKKPLLIRESFKLRERELAKLHVHRDDVT